MRILIIEDDEAIRDTLRDILEINGHEVIAAGTGSEGISSARLHPEMILCDVGLPDMDGYAVIEQIQKDPEVRTVPFIFVTAMAGRNEQRRGMVLGADDYITKPFNEREILEAIESRVRRQKPLRERIAGLKDQFQREASAEWSHELLTPLNAVLGGLALIESEVDTLDRGELKLLLGLIRSGAERQYRLVRKLILHFELERLATLAVKPAAVLLASRADGVIVAAAARVARDEGREADLDLRCEAGSVGLHEEYLSAAVGEMVENGFRFSKPGQHVTVRGTVGAGRYRIEVVDAGCGLSAEQRSRVGPFVQFDRASREQQGLGLGLAIVRAVAEMAGGSMRLEEASPGPGLRVILELPLVG